MELEKLELIRQKANKNYKRYLILGTTILFILVIFALTTMIRLDFNTSLVIKMYPTIAIFGMISIVMSVLFYKATKSKKEFFNAVKETVIKQIGNDKFEGFEFNVKSHISKTVINQVGILQKPSQIYGEDHLLGKYENVSFEVSDIRLDQTSNESTDTYFKGRWYIFKFNKNFNETIKIVNGSRLTINTKDLKREETELTKFNKKYNFYASNKTFFYQFMTPLMIEKLSEFYEEFKGKVSFALINNEFHIAINDNSDFLKIDIKSEINEANIIKLKEEVISIITIIEHFELNSKQFN